MTVLSLAASAAAEDVVYLSSADDPGGQLRVAGEILDYTGQAIRIRTSTGLERSYAADRVNRIETRYRDEQVAGDKAQSEGEFAQAVQHYRAALNQETRLWARRKIMAELIWCYRAVDLVEPACDTFLLLVKSDPSTRDLGAIPLAWTAAEDIPRQKAEAWLERTQSPAAVLLGASHLLGTERREDALRALRQLTASRDRSLAMLAEGQLWRAHSVQAGPQETDHWAEQIDRMPEGLRAGPYYLLGRALLRQQRWEEAALALMRVPILYERDRRLSAEALLGAGTALEQLQRPDQATQLYQEIAQNYPRSRPGQEAQQRFERLQGR